jgi:hypothetical protein
VRFVNSAAFSPLVSTFGTYAVRNVNSHSPNRAGLTKCTGKPDPPP